MVGDTSAGILKKKKKGKEKKQNVYMTNSEIWEVYLFMNSQSCMRHSSDTYCRTDTGTAG